MTMARTPVPASIEQLRHSSSIEAQIAALKHLKNEIVGHDQRKQSVIEHGIVSELARILVAMGRKGEKRKLKNGIANGGGVSLSEPQSEGVPLNQGFGTTGWTNDEELRWQATVVVWSLAHGGLASVAPLLKGGIAEPLLSALAPRDTPPKLLLWTLRALLVLVEAVSTDLHFAEHPLSGPFVDMLFSKQVLDQLADIYYLRSHIEEAIWHTPNSSGTLEEEASIVAQIITHACRTQQHQAALVRAGILDHLAAELVASICYDEAFPLPISPSSPVLSNIAGSRLTHILEATSTIIRGSSYRSACLIYSPAAMTLWHLSSQDTSTDQPAYSSRLQRYPKGMDDNGDSPDFSTWSDANKTRPVYGSNYEVPSPVKPVFNDDTCGPLIEKLIATARKSSGLERLAAVWLLTLLISAFDQNFPDFWPESARDRDRTLAFLIVPLIINMLEEVMSEQKTSVTGRQTPGVVTRKIKERAPLALAILIESSEELQKAAFDAHAIKVLTQMLKRTFDPVSARPRPMWSPTPTSTMQLDENNTQTNPTNSAELSADAVHALRCRAAAMEALAAICQKQDAYRRKILEQGVISYVIDSLNPYRDGAFPSDPSHQTSGKEGNPDPVIVSACNFCRALARSVNVLRTSLMDVGVAKPIFALLTHPNIEVQLAATDVVCNLVLHFSPMRDELIKSGVMNILCDHAHSADPRMQVVSLWALKHLMDASSNDIKYECLDNIGTGWLIQTIIGESKDGLPPTGQSRLSTPIGMGTPNAAGEQVDMLNPVEYPAMDVDEDSIMSDYDEDETNAPTSTYPESRRRLRTIKEAEQSPSIRAYKNDMRVQEQAIDFIRNVFSHAGPGPETAEVMDRVLRSLGTERLFEILISKLAHKPYSSSSQEHQQQPQGKRPTLTTPSTSAYSHPPPAPTPPPAAQLQYYYPPEIIHSALNVLVHIANGESRHRTLVVSQPGLTHAVIPLFTHPDPKIRVSCCWLVLNLTYSEHSGDWADTARRARELRNCGVERAMRGLLNDSHLDCRERARAAVEAFGKMLNEEEGQGGWARRGQMRGVES